MKKIRKLYWHMRDRGKGKQMILLSLVFILSIISVLGLIGKGIYTSVLHHKNSSQVMLSENDVNSDGTTDVTTGNAVSASGISVDEEVVQEDTLPPTSQELGIDVSGLEPFLGFKSDTAYENMVASIVSTCQQRSCKYAKKLNFQITKENDFNVTSFVLLSDGHILQVNYNLKSTQYSVADTDYTEAQIQQMNLSKQEAERKALEAQQAKDKVKIEKQKKASQKKAAKKNKGKKKAKKGKLKKNKSKKKHR